MRSLPGLWLCADLGEMDPTELVDRVVRVLETGPAVVWLRSPPGTPAGVLVELSTELLRQLRGASALLVGDRVDVALAVGAHGVHLTERSLLPEDARRIARHAGRRDLLLSQSAHDAAGVASARGAVDALVLSPYGAVEGKGPALGVEGWGALRREAPEVFAVALGGITDAESVAAAMGAGADGVAVRRALSRSADPAAACAALRSPMP